LATVSVGYIQDGPKQLHTKLINHNFVNFNDFPNNCTGRFSNTFTVDWLSWVPSQFACVATLPCETENKRLPAHHLALAVSAFAAFVIWNSLPPSLRTSTSPDIFRLPVKTTPASRPSSPLQPFLLAPQIWLLLTIVRVYKLYLRRIRLRNSFCVSMKHHDLQIFMMAAVRCLVVIFLKLRSLTSRTE